MNRRGHTFFGTKLLDYAVDLEDSDELKKYLSC